MSTEKLRENVRHISFYNAHHNHEFSDWVNTELGQMSANNAAWLADKYELFDLDYKIKRLKVRIERNGKSISAYRANPEYSIAYNRTAGRLKGIHGFAPSLNQIVTVMRTNKIDIKDSRVTILDIQEWNSGHVKTSPKCKICAENKK